VGVTEAWLAGEPVDDLLARVGPGLAPAPDAAPIDARSWNAFAFTLGIRLARAYAHRPNAGEHVVDQMIVALAQIASIDELLADPEATTKLAITEATLRPFTMFAQSSAAELLMRLFRWGTRRVFKDRKLADSLAKLAAEAIDAHAECAGLAGADPDAARAAERAAQLADARTVLAGNARSLFA
jgi:hypothetical protein